ncbi:MAG: sialate O-acetylesterase [Phycisphaerae bacterium]|jgi:sialate O-acetylesterase
MNKRIIGSLALIVLIASFATADVRLPAIISDNMVIQADAKAPIWGWAGPNETVTVTIGKQKQTATANADGKWMVKLPAMKTSNTPLEMTIAGKNTITVKNILIGQVWLSSGQSNMNMTVGSAGNWQTGVLNCEQEVANARYPTIRLFTVQQYAAFSPIADCNGRWVECSPKTVGSFSAVAYFFGRELYKELNQPVGLINSSWGGTIAETWMSAGSLHANPDFASILQRHKDLIKIYPNGQADYDKAFAQWQKNANDAEKAGNPQPAKPAPLLGQQNPNGASLLYNGMIAPIIPYAIKGAIWYQGESNSARAKQYQTLFPALIADWRNQWHEGDFPFLFVQIADFRIPPGWFSPLAWVELREAQLKTLSVPNTGMAVTTDIGDANNIHPKNKQEVGRRLALWAMAKTYGKKIEYSGPVYKNMKVDAGKIHLTFIHADGGLVVKGGELKGFTIAGDDKKFVPAKAAIKDGTVIVESSEVKEPAAVRYGWSDVTTECNLFNAAGLPASPFRTDDWPGVTDNEK